MFRSASLPLKDGRKERNTDGWKAKAARQKKGGQESLAWCVKQKGMEKGFLSPNKKQQNFGPVIFSFSLSTLHCSKAEFTDCPRGFSHQPTGGGIKGARVHRKENQE